MATSARIGPNAILQLLPVLDEVIGVKLRGALMFQADVAEPPATSGMVPEDDVARLHHAVRLFLPDRAAAIQHAAGLATGDYILRHRIPRLAQMLIRALPAWLGARVLTAAIAKHSWTFAGSGRFAIVSHTPLVLEIAGNPLAQSHAESPLCHWHAAVFERLYGRLVWPDVRVTEIACTAMGARACQFRIVPR